MNKDQIIEIIKNNTTADTLEEAVSVYYGIFDQIDFANHTEEDVLSDLREAKERGDTQVETFRRYAVEWDNDRLYAVGPDYAISKFAQRHEIELDSEVVKVADASALDFERTLDASESVVSYREVK